MSEETKRKLVLGFLQERALEIRRAYAERGADVVEARISDDEPARIVLVLDPPDWSGEQPEFYYRGVRMLPEIAGQSRPIPAVQASEAKAEQASPETDEAGNPAYAMSEEEMKNLGISKIPDPSNTRVRNREAYEAWKARFAKKDPPPPAPADEPVRHQFSPEQLKSLDMSEALGAHPETARDPKAFQEWQARFGRQQSPPTPTPVQEEGEKTYHQFSPEDAEKLGISELPGSRPDKARDPAAFEEWKKRFEGKIK